LTRDITSASAITLDVQGSDVHIDLNGFTVENTEGTGHAIAASFADRLTVANGTVKGGRYGVLLENSEAVTLTRIRFT
jgi:hypothetical protein